MIDIFLQFEKKHNMFEKEICNIKFWHLIRFEIYNEILKKQQNIPKAHQAKVYNNFIYLAISKIKQLSNLWNRNPYQGLTQKDILLFNHHRRVKDGENYIDMYTSDLINHLDNNYFVYEDHYQEKHFKPVPEKNIKYTDVITNSYLIKRIFYRIFNKKILRNSEKKDITTLVKDINLEFKVSLNERKWIKKIENKIINYQVMYEAYSAVIDEVKPKLIIQVVSYLNSRFVINKIAKEKGIPTVELQHGTMGKYHIAYNFSDKMNIETFPDYVLTFGDYWKENTRLPIDDSKVISVGWPYYEDKVKKQNKVNSNKSTLLFISQGTIGKQLSKIAKEVEESIDFDKYRIIYKLHPGEYDVWRENYPWLINSSIEVIDHNDFDMHYYFNQADIQIGVNSTAIFEGLGYDLRTIILKLHNYEYMEELYKNNYASLVSSSEEIIRELDKNEKNIIIDQEYFWKSDSMNNMFTEINKIIKEK